MIEKFDSQNGFCMADCMDKINEVIDAVNVLQENQNTYWTDIAEIKKELQTRPENVHPDAESRPENVLTKSLRMDKEFAEEECKRLQAELERTRKALEIAVDALNTIKGKHDPRCAVYHIDEKTAYDALEQITAQEQKDVK